MKRLAFYLRKSILIALVFGVISTFAACGKPVEKITEASSYLTLLGNYYSGNIITKLGDRTFFMLDKENQGSLCMTEEVLKKEDLVGKPGKSVTYLCSDCYKYFVTSGGVFYTKRTNGGIYYKTFDSSKETQLSDITCYELVVSGNNIYFTDENGGLFVLPTLGGSATQLYVGCQPENILPTKNYLYFCDKTPDPTRDIFMIYRYSFDTKTVETVGDGKTVERFFVYKNWIYYLEDSNLFCFDLNDQNLVKLTDDKRILPDSMNIYGQYLLYSDTYNGGNIFAIDMDTKQERKVYSKAYRFIFVVGNKLFTDKDIITLKL